MRMGGHGPPGMGLPRVTEEAGLLRSLLRSRRAYRPRYLAYAGASAPLHLLCTSSAPQACSATCVGSTAR